MIPFKGLHNSFNEEQLRHENGAWSFFVNGVESETRWGLVNKRNSNMTGWSVSNSCSFIGSVREGPASNRIRVALLLCMHGCLCMSVC